MLEFRPAGARSIRWVWWVILCVIAVGLLVPMALMARTWWGARSLAYRVEADAVTIRYAPETVRIPRTAITGAYVLEQPTQRRRLMGTAMPGLYAGRWSFAETERITLYCTTLNRVVVMETPNGKWGITPADPEGFLQALAAGQVGLWSPARAGAFPWIVLLPLAEVPIFLLIIWAVRAYLPDPRSIRYTLEDGALVVRGGMTRVAVRYDAISAATVASPDGRPLKAWGAALPGLYWGGFVWKQAAPNLKLYATELRPLVLITAGRTTYGINPAEPEQFVAELARRIGG